MQDLVFFIRAFRVLVNLEKIELAIGQILVVAENHTRRNIYNTFGKNNKI